MTASVSQRPSVAGDHLRHYPVYSGDQQNYMGTGVVLESRPECERGRVILHAIPREINGLDNGKA